MKRVLALLAILLVVLPGCQKDKEEPYHFKVVYHGNGGVTSDGKTKVEKAYLGRRGTVMHNCFTYVGNKSFVLWTDNNGNTYNPEQEISGYNNSTLELYAYWIGHYTITFDANGGTGTMNPQMVTEGVSTKLNPNAFTRNGYVFEKWTTKADGTGTSYYDNAYVTIYDDMTLYAKWMQGEWLYYGDFDNHYQYWGLTNGGTEEWAVRFPSNLLSGHSGSSITKCRVNVGKTGSYTLKIYKGGTTSPTTLMKSQSFYVSTIGWNTIVLNNALALDTSTPLWISLTVTHNSGQHPMGSSRGINNPDVRWRCYGGNGSNWDNSLSNGWEDVCWEIQGYISNEKGEPGDEIMLPLCPNEQSSTTNDASLDIPSHE